MKPIKFDYGQIIIIFSIKSKLNHFPFAKLVGFRYERKSG